MSIIGAKLGIKLELEFVNSLGQKIGQTYISQLMDIIDVKNIVIAAPIHESRVMFVSNGTKARILFLHNRMGLVSFLGTITSKEHAQNLVLFKIHIDSELEKIQRRNYFRLDCLLDAFYCYQEQEPAPEENSDDQSKDKEYKKALAKNISGSGACIVVEEEIPKDANVDVIIKFNSDTSIKSACRVMRSIKIEGTKEKKFEIGLHFTKISFRDQDAVIKYVFDQQRTKMKNNSGDR